MPKRIDIDRRSLLAAVATGVPMLLAARTSGRLVDGMELVLYPGTDPLNFYGVTDPDQLAWMKPRLTPHPWKCFEQKLSLSGRPLPPRGYIYCTRLGPQDVFGPFARRAKAEGWRYAEMDASHNPHITCPEALRDVLQGMMKA